MTEMSPVSHMMPLGRAGRDIGSIGELMPSMRCKIVDDTGREVGVGERGELWLAGPNIMQGYLSRPEATASTIDADGYLHTGDACRPAGSNPGQAAQLLTPSGPGGTGRLRRRGRAVLHCRPRQGADQGQGLPGD